MEQWYKDGEVFGSQQAIRNDNKGSSLPHFLSDGDIEAMGYLKVVDAIATPVPSAVQYVVEDTITLIDGVPTQEYKLVDMFADTAEYTDMNGVVVPAKTKLQHETEYLAKMQADVMAKVVQHFTDTTTAYIEAKVAEYNAANGLAFKDIDAFTKYAVTPTSVHNAIAIRFINYADRLWNTVRTYQSTATTVPTEEEFKAILASVVF